MMDAPAWPTAESRIFGSIPVTGLEFKTTIMERKNNNPFWDLSYLLPLEEGLRFAKKKQKGFWLRGRGRFSTRLYVLVLVHVQVHTVSTYVCVCIPLEGIQLEQTCS